MVLDKDDGYEHHEMTGFQGLAHVYETFMLDLAGATEIPATKLFGRSPAGLSATGQSDLQNYYDSIHQKQEAQLRPALEKLLPVIMVSEWGEVPDDLDFSFNSPQTFPVDELADLAGKYTDNIINAHNSGLISQKIGMKELRQLADTTGLFTNITDEDIEGADNLIGLPTEMLPDFRSGHEEVNPSSEGNGDGGGPKSTLSSTMDQAPEGHPQINPGAEDIHRKSACVDPAGSRSARPGVACGDAGSLRVYSGHDRKG